MAEMCAAGFFVFLILDGIGTACSVKNRIVENYVSKEENYGKSIGKSVSPA